MLFFVKTTSKINNILFKIKENYYCTAFKLETTPYKLFKLDSGPSTSVSLTKKDGLELYEKLNMIRRMETEIGNLYKSKHVRGFCHLYSGQEAIAVGIKASLRPEDTIITAYRSHGFTLLSGVPMLKILSELLGKVTGCSRGRGGSMHTYGPNFYGGNGIVGAHVPVGTGLGFAHKYNNSKAISVTLYGDGAANQGQVYESFNIAKLSGLPVLFVCENNGYGMGTSASRSSASTAYYTRADYIPGIWVDGMDLLATREATRFAIEYINSGKGPLLMEAETYRYYGHSMSDPGSSYRTREEVKSIRDNKDPIHVFKNKLLTANIATKEELKKIEDSAKKYCAEIVSKAKLEKEVEPSDLTADIYASYIGEDIRNIDAFHPLAHKRVGPAINIDRSQQQVKDKTKQTN